jgi:hypothetical protein
MKGVFFRHGAGPQHMLRRSALSRGSDVQELNALAVNGRGAERPELKGFPRRERVTRGGPADGSRSWPVESLGSGSLGVRVAAAAVGTFVIAALALLVAAAWRSRSIEFLPCGTAVELQDGSYAVLECEDGGPGLPVARRR